MSKQVYFVDSFLNRDKLKKYKKNKIFKKHNL